MALFNVHVVNLIECRFNVTSSPTFLGVNGTENRTGIHSGIIRHTDVPKNLTDYVTNFNTSLECIWNITVTPGWKVSCAITLTL